MTMVKPLKTIAAGKFKPSRPPGVMDVVQATVKRSALQTMEAAGASSCQTHDDEIFGHMAGRVRTVEDTVSPATDLNTWDAMR